MDSDWILYDKFEGHCGTLCQLTLAEGGILALLDLSIIQHMQW